MSCRATIEPTPDGTCVAQFLAIMRMVQTLTRKKMRMVPTALPLMIGQLQVNVISAAVDAAAPKRFGHLRYADQAMRFPCRN